ncbi:putative pentatricopeptide repeat-containing protein At5g08490 [Macadamia integrifolia]|uniref:putative pentatricopeptide repeat-containing protein At5g08490 n=1 Tax=Macadamia integrifolia TaxID=60698 RepID=UPI001C532C4A|nr:putative pentatricopeptide repeat-containing protein At5g08490 [Macadamia integrifolia]
MIKPKIRFFFLHLRSDTRRLWFPLHPHRIASKFSYGDFVFVHGRCGHVHQPFDSMSQWDPKTWDAMFRDYCVDAKHMEALSLVYQRMHFSESFRLDHQVMAALLKSCAAVSAIELGKSFHGYTVKFGHEASEAVSKSLMNMYAKCRALHDCHRLFVQMSRGDPVLWNILLSGYAGSRRHDLEAMELFYAMHVWKEEPKPNSITVAIILPVCARSRDLHAGKSVHAHVIKSGFESETLVGNSLVSMYAKCSCLGDAFVAFRGIAYEDVVSWNAIISGYAENGFFADAFELFRQMLAVDCDPNYATIVNILPVCVLLEHDGKYRFGEQIHGYVMRRPQLVADISVYNALVSFYSRIGRLAEAESIFCGMKSRDLVSWNAIIAGYASNGEPWKALELFYKLLSMEMVEPDSVTLVTILPICAQLCNAQEGKKIHEYIFQHPELCQDTAVGNALISFYAKCNDMEAALKIFSTIPRRDLISWNTMLDAYAERGCAIQLVYLLHRMLKEGLQPDSITLLTILRVCANVSREAMVKEVHGYSIRKSLLPCDLEPSVGNMILDAYTKCGNMDYAFKTFESLLGRRNVVTCNSLISGFVDCGSWENAEMIFGNMSKTDLTTWNLMVRVYAESDYTTQALSLFHELQAQGMRPDAISVMSLIPVCARLASVHLLKQCHAFVLRSCFEDLRLNGALLDMYAKCGSIDYAYKFFQSCSQKDLVMFTAIVCGYAMHGMGEEALRVFSEMLELGIKPDHVIFTAILSACSHAGLVNEGFKLFESIEMVHGIKPTMEHYSCVVDLLARGGRLQDAYSFVNSMPVGANANVWGTLLGACRTHHEVELGRVVADHLFEVEAGDIGNYVLLSNIYAADARWDGVNKVRRLMKMRDLRKPAGCSWIEVQRKMNVFVAGDFSHPQRSLIYNMLSTLDQQIKEPCCSSENIVGVN